MLNFIDQLDAEQAANAEKVALAAKQAGVDPRLAVAIAFQESKLRSNPPRGSSGEIGIMQVMPGTGRGMGYNEKQLSDIEKNIEAGIQYLKKGLAATGNDPQLTAIYYNGGPGAVQTMMSGKDPDPRVYDYLRSVNSYGTFAARPGPEKPAAPQADGEMVLEDVPPSLPKKPDVSGATPGERFLMGTLGAGAGLFSTGTQGVLASRNQSAARRAGLEERARIAEQRAAGALPAQRPAIEPDEAARRIVQGTTDESGTTGRQRQSYNERTAQIAARQKQAEQNILNLQRQGVVASSAQDLLANAPGGTATKSGVYAPAVEAGQYGGPRGPGGERGFYRPPPPAGPGVMQRIGSGLQGVTEKLGSLSRTVLPGATTLGKYVAPPLGGIAAGLDVAELAHEYQKPEDQRDYLKMALKGAGVAGGALSMIPATMPLGFAVSAAVPALEYAREKGYLGLPPPPQ
jgi:hypothetical protein